LDTVQMLLAINPDHKDYLFTKCKLYALQGRYDQAISTLNKLLRISPNDELLLKLKVRYYEKSDQYDNAYLVQQDLHKIGIDIEFKISVFMGNDNPYAVFWTLMAARMFSRDDGSTSLIGFNFSNSVNNSTIELSSEIRKSLGLEDFVRFEHHILETWKSIVVQPYDRRDELLDIACKVKNISAKHEGGEVDTETTRDHPSDILDYFAPKVDLEKKGLISAVTQNYLDKHAAINNTARALTQKGLTFIAAPNLHHRE